MNARLCVPVPYSVCFPGPSICLQSWYFHFSSQTTIALCIITTFMPPSHILMDIVTFFHVVAIEIRRVMNMNEHSPVKVDFQSGRAVMTFIWQVISFTQRSSFHKVVLWATDVPALKLKNLDWISLTTYSCSNSFFLFHVRIRTLSSPLRPCLSLPPWHSLICPSRSLTCVEPTRRQQLLPWVYLFMAQPHTQYLLCSP